MHHTLAEYSACAQQCHALVAVVGRTSHYLMCWVSCWIVRGTGLPWSPSVNLSWYRRRPRSGFESPERTQASSAFGDQVVGEEGEGVPASPTTSYVRPTYEWPTFPSVTKRKAGNGNISWINCILGRKITNRTSFVYCPYTYLAYCLTHKAIICSVV